MINEPVQKLLLAIGETGCLFLSIVRAAENITFKALNELVVFVECARRVSLNEKGEKKQWVEADCFVNFPAYIFEYLVGGKWIYSWESVDYKPIEGDVVILRYEWKNTKGISNHFVLGDKDKKVTYDPMGASNTVLNGKLASLRILRRAK